MPSATTAATATATRAAMFSPTALPMQTPTHTPTAVPTLNPSPMPTAMSALDVDPGKGRYATATPTATAGPTGTHPLVFATATPLPSLAYESVYTLVSPDGGWVAQGLAFPPGADRTYHTALRVWRTDGSANGVRDATVLDRVENWGLGWTTPRPLRWSHDGRALYWTEYGVPDGCPGFGNGWGLYQVDLADGSSREVLPWDAATWIELSPQEERLAYVPRTSHAVIVRDLETGAESTYALQTGQDDPTASIGHILWAPDEATSGKSALVLTVALDRCLTYGQVAQSHTILHLDLETGAETILVDRDSRWLTTQAWPDPNSVILVDTQARHWRLDLVSAKITLAEDLDRALPASCLADDGATSLYFNTEEGYCLRYPDYFQVSEVAQRITAFSGPPLDNSIEPLMAGVTVFVEGPIGRRTLSVAVDEWLAGRNLPPPESRYTSALGGELAEVVEYQGELSRGRAIFALRANMLYVLTFHPIDERFARAAPDVKAAWEAVTGSFAFIPPTFLPMPLDELKLEHEILSGLTVQEHVLRGAPQVEPLAFEPVQGTAQEILQQHQAERDKHVRRSRTTEQTVMLDGDQLAATEIYTDTIQDQTGGVWEVCAIQVTCRGRVLYTVPTGLPSPINKLRGLWVHEEHWYLEVADDQGWGQIIRDGESLNELRGYEETFGFQLLHGEPFYFFKRAGQIGVFYAGHELATKYDHIPHYFCCSGAELNPVQSEYMVAFFGQREETWYYVEMGVYE